MNEKVSRILCFLPLLVCLLLAGPSWSQGLDEGMPEEDRGQSPSGILDLNLQDAILLSLENNPSLRVERLSPPIQSTFEEQERAVFDPVLGAGTSYSRRRGQERPRNSATGAENTENRVDAEIDVSRRFPTGTEVGIGFSAPRTWSDLYTDQVVPRVGLSVTQALLRGGGARPTWPPLSRPG